MILTNRQIEEIVGAAFSESLRRDIADMIEEECNRLVTEVDKTRPLSILEVRGEDLRWESERFDSFAPRKEDIWADGLLAHGDGAPRQPPKDCPLPDSWNGGWDYGHHQKMRKRT